MHKTTQVKQSILVAVLITVVLSLSFLGAYIIYINMGPEEGSRTFFGLGLMLLFCAAYAVYDTLKQTR